MQEEILKTGISLNKKAIRILTDSIAKHYHKRPNSLKSLKDIVEKNEDKPKFVSQAVVESIAEYYHCKSDTMEWLQGIAKDDKQHESIRRVAIRSIADYYHMKEDLNILTWLHDRFDLDKHELVRRESVRAIAKYYHNPNTLIWLRDRVMQDEKGWVRASAIQELACYYHNDINTCKLIQNSVNDKSPDVKLAVVRSIAKYYPDQLEWLKKCVVDSNLIEVAIESISKYHKNEDILASVKEFALKSKDKLVLQKALRSMAKCYPQNNGVLIWLEECASNQDKDVRSVAIQSISLHYLKKISPDRVEQLKQDILALSDSPKNQKIAIQSIAKHYQQESSTLEWLQGCAEKAEHELVSIAALNSIVLYHDQKPEILKWLKDLKSLKTAQKNQPTVESIVKSIAIYYPQELEWLKKCASNEEESSFVRDAAVKSIELYYGHEPEISEWLKDIKSSKKGNKKNQPKPKLPQLCYVQASEQDYEKQCGIKSIDNYYHKEPDTLIRLQKIALEDKEADVRLAAVESIVKYYPEEGDTLKYLQEIAMEAHDLNVRLAAVESIAKYYCKQSLIFTWLKECALNDHEPLVRSVSLRAINEYFPKNNEVDKILQLVIDRDLDRNIDDEEYPKAVAVQILKDKYR
jgi:HEAT repeats